MIFGGDHAKFVANFETSKYNHSECVRNNLINFHQENVEGMEEPGRMIFSLYQLTLVDEYDLKVSISRIFYDLTVSILLSYSMTLR